MDVFFFSLICKKKKMLHKEKKPKIFVNLIKNVKFYIYTLHLLLHACDDV